ncbi:MAG: NEW3 domain-containing protein [Candidatus Methanoperedens sp.]|nr:NEW3 domain-containing protein [Candidatus Methanoperedens sp.]PKL54471.1 MAG: hypothetical protein CVV36_01670 [Candidatus Methanoperedenaceae archaeon HGW-Methanoperedenaceae-1]
MKSRLLTQVIVSGIVLVIISMLAAPVFGAPLTGVQGSRVQVNFMSQDPDPADAGKDLDLRWQVVNTVSGSVDSLSFRLDAGYPFLFEAGDSPYKELGASAGTNEDKTFYILHYKLRAADNAVKGTYNVTLNWNFGSGWIKQEFPVYLDPKRADFVVGSLTTSPEKLIADTDDAKLSVGIDNIGKGNAENVKVKLLMPEGFKATYSYSDEDSLGIIEKGASKQADFYVDIGEDVTEGEYDATLEVSYKDENDDSNKYKTQNIGLKIPVKPAPFLIVDSVKSTPGNIVPGTEAVVLVTVKNTGNEKAESVSLRVFKDAAQPFDFSEKSDFIGKLDSGDSGEAAIKFTVEKNAVPKKYLVDVELRGIDDKQNVVIFRRTITITVNDGSSAFPLKTVGVLGGLAAVVGVAGLTYYRRNGRNKRL